MSLGASLLPVRTTDLGGVLSHEIGWCFLHPGASPVGADNQEGLRGIKAAHERSLTGAGAGLELPKSPHLIYALSGPVSSPA